MPWPVDPMRQEEIRARLRASSAARWARLEERERARAKALAYFSDPEARKRMSELKLRQYQERPEIRDKIAAGQASVPRVSRRTRPVFNHEARLQVARSDGEMRQRRLSLIAERVQRKAQNGSV